MNATPASNGELLFGSCPVPKLRYDQILLGHGSGGQLTADLIQRLFVPGFNDPILASLEDQATVSLELDCLYGGQIHSKRASSPMLFVASDADVRAVYARFEQEFSEAFSPLAVNDGGGVYSTGANASLSISPGVVFLANIPDDVS